MTRTWFALIGLLALTSNVSYALEAGAAAADITPDVKTYKVPMAGYGARMGRPSTGVHDPLHAKILVLRDGKTQMALITCDLRSITPEFKNQIVQKTASLGFTPDNVLISASHTHDGPSMFAEKFWQLQFGKYDPKIVDTMSTNVANALKQAVKSAAPAKIGFGQGRADEFTHNRRWGYDTAAREAAGEKPNVEPVLWVMRVDSMDGKPKTILVNFATHPTILDADNMLISAEWPGVLQQELEKTFPGATAMFANGAEGDQSPQGAQGATAFDKVADFGMRLAKVAADIAKKVETKPNVSIAYRRATPDLPPLAFPEASKKKYAAFAEAAKNDLPRKAEIQIFRIGSTALVGLPGEPILAVGQSVRDSVSKQGFEHAIVIGLADDYIGYLVNEKEYAHGGYEVDSRSYYGPGLGSFLTEQAANVAKELKPHAN